MKIIQNIIDHINGILFPIILILSLTWGGYAFLHIGRFLENEVYHKFLKVEFDRWYYSRE